MSRQPFEPWKRDQSRAAKGSVAGAALFGGGVLFALNGNHALALALGAAGLAFLGQGAFLFKRAKNRAFGKRLEEAFAPRGAQALVGRGFETRANVMVRGIGDVDLIAYINDEPVPIEIKSFRRWNQFLIFMGERERKTLSQVWRQKQALNAPVAFVWLPQGSPTLLQRLFGAGSGSIRVVFGRERELVRAVERMRIKG